MAAPGYLRAGQTEISQLFKPQYAYYDGIEA